jgi:glyoxylase-like metal-dependent hydrolase (beta-lactamase superfamily II)
MRAPVFILARLRYHRGMSQHASPPPFQVQVVPVTPFQQNCSIIKAPSGKAAVVDPGGEPEKILKAAEAFGATIEQIWLTHGHLDHAGGAGLSSARPAPRLSVRTKKTRSGSTKSPITGRATAIRGPAKTASRTNG